MLTEIRERSTGVFAWVIAAIIIIPGLISFSVIKNRLTGTLIGNWGRNLPSKTLNQSELKLQQHIYQRVESLNLNSSVFYSQVDQKFNQQHPELSGVQLTEIIEHRPYRESWYQIAINLLEQLETKR